jgi:hypothetical protein
MAAIYYITPYNYDSTSTTWSSIDFNQGVYSSTYIELPPDEAESEEVQVCPWLFLLPEDQRDLVVRPPTARPPRRPARCRDPPG